VVEGGDAAPSAFKVGVRDAEIQKACLPSAHERDEGARKVVRSAIPGFVVDRRSPFRACVLPPRSCKTALSACSSSRPPPSLFCQRARGSKIQVEGGEGVRRQCRMAIPQHEWRPPRHAAVPWDGPQKYAKDTPVLGERTA